METTQATNGKTLTEKEQAAKDAASAFRKLPEHIQVKTRFDRASERLDGHVEELEKWASDERTTPANRGVLQEIADKVKEASQQLKDASEMLGSELPKDYRAPQERAAARPVGTFEVGETYKLRGNTAKDEPENAKHPVKVLEVINNAKGEPSRARVLGANGDKFSMPLRDLAALD